MHLISAPRNLLISLTSIRGAKILQTVRKLDASLPYGRAENRFSRFFLLCAATGREIWAPRSVPPSFRTVCLIFARCHKRLMRGGNRE